ncbi:MAG: ABC transporter substrate-binding protein [Desulfuromonadaceae bacterium]|nr:ABC transporter substrate-binding protein [Desulfuromonadaceae bacterium]
MIAHFRLPPRLFPALVLLALSFPLSSTAAQDNERLLRFAFQNRIGSVLPILAVKKKFFTAQGLAVESQMFSSGPACAEALTSGAADIATMGDTTALIALARQFPLELIASHAKGEHRHRLMVMDPAIQTVADLRGRRIGVKKGTSTYGGLEQLLANSGLTQTDVQLIDLRPATLVEALQAGSIDAFAASEPTPSQAEQYGAHQLTTLGGLGNNYPILIVGDKRFIAAHPDQLQAFKQALLQALDFLQQQPQKARQIIAETLNLPLEVTIRAMQRHQYQLVLDDSIRHSLRQTAEFLRQQRIIEQIPEL